MNLLKETCTKISDVDAKARQEAKDHIQKLTMPPWALGRLLDLAVDLAGITGQCRPDVARKEIILMAADHGIAREGVCPQPSDITGQMVRNFAKGGAGINVLARLNHTRVTIVDMGVLSDMTDLVREGKILDYKVAPGTQSFRHGPAMTREQAIQSIESGIAIVNQRVHEVDVFGTGEMGIGNTSPSSAILTVLAHTQDPTPYVGRGAGLPESKLGHKIDVIRQGIEHNQPDPTDPIDILAKVGGFEIGGIAGVILGAAAHHKPVVVDGFISSAGALIAAQIEPRCKDYMILAHGSAEPGHQKMAELLGCAPYLALGLRLGEGSGAALAMNLIDAASAIMNHMATFFEADVSTEGIQ